jgi:hypothetical protein
MDDSSGRGTGPETEDSLIRDLRASAGYEQARRLDALLRESEPATTELTWHSPTASAYRVGADLQVLDRELRRAAAIVANWQEGEPLPRPVSAQQGHLEISSSSAGSFDAVLGAVGVVSMVLLSDPVQLLLTTQALIAAPFSVKAWLKRKRSEPLPEPTATLEFPGGARATGRRIQFHRTYADGTEDLIIVE